MQRLQHTVFVLFLTSCGGGAPPAEEPTGQDEVENPPSAEACPLFCTRTEGACTRPDVDDVSDAPCGAMSRIGDDVAREACPDHCCRPAEPSEGEDTDADGLVDADDRCVNEPEDAEGYEDQDGCPDNDNDGDQISDSQDVCCFAAEDADGVQDEDGCPDP